MNLHSKIILVTLAFSIANISFAQDLDKHIWKERVLLIFSDNVDRIKKQSSLLKLDTKGLKERKLVIYKVNRDQYQEGIHSNKWMKSKKLNLYSKTTNKKIEVVLIGLDGGVKLRQTEILTTEKLFTIIDGMPMRKQELRKKKY